MDEISIGMWRFAANEVGEFKRLEQAVDVNESQVRQSRQLTLDSGVDVRFSVLSRVKGSLDFREITSVKLRGVGAWDFATMS